MMSEQEIEHWVAVMQDDLDFRYLNSDMKETEYSERCLFIAKWAETAYQYQERR